MLISRITERPLLRRENFKDIRKRYMNPAEDWPKTTGVVTG